jgi:long-chain acyl-CoA synthetase
MLMELLQGSAFARADAVALVHRDRRVTYAQLVERIERLAAGLVAEGIRPGDAVALRLPNEPDFVAAYHAIAALGAIVVPVNPAFKAAEVEFCFRSCGVRMAITDDEGAALCEPLVERVVRASELDALMREPPGELPSRAPDEPVVCLFSSGSTGRPKPVQRTHGHLRAEAGFYPAMGIGPDDVIFNTVPLFHSYGMGFCLLAAAGSGATMVMLEDPNPFVMRRGRALELLERERVTVFPGVPFNFRLLAEAQQDADLSSLRLCLSAGSALPGPVYDAFLAKFGVPVRQHYGCTEAGSLTANLDDDPSASWETVGKSLGSVEIEIVDGEVAVRSPAAASGYAEGADQDGAFGSDGYFMTGDLGVLDEEGRLTITGRRKLVIEVGGYKVDPVEVQDVVEAHPGVHEAVVVGVNGTHALGEQVVKAVVVPAADVDEQELIDFCRERLANYKVPQLVEFREEIPRSALGKVLRKYLVD